MKMRNLLIAGIAALGLQMCGGSQGAPGGVVENLSMEQLDSIGKSFVPEIGVYGGTVRLPLESDPDGFCPATASSGYSNQVMSYFFEGLITTDAVTLEHIPHIAKSWQVSDDGLVWTFSMRDDVFFSDGVKLSAHDVTFTFNDVIYNPQIRSPLADNFSINGRRIKVTALDSFTVRFELPAPFAPFLTVAGMDIMPRHRYATHAQNGTLEAFLSNSAKPSDVVGSGPFILDKVELGQRVVLRRNPNYWKKDAAGNRLPYIDQVIFLIIKEPNVAMLKFRNGEIDHIIVQGEHYPILKPLEKELGFTLYKVGPRWYDGFLVFNMNNQKNPKTGRFYLDERKQRWFRNQRFRQACAYAINYQAMIDIIYNGLAYPPAGIWGKHKGFFHNPDAPTYSYDPERAKRMLAEEGFVDRNGDGILEDSTGAAVEFTLSTAAGVQVIKQMAEMVRKDFENIGLKVHLNLIEFNHLMDKLQNSYDWDIAAYSLGGITDPHFGKSSQTSSSFRYVINPNQKTPSYPWEARINEIFELGVSEMDREKRRALYGEWQQIIMDQSTHIYLPLREVILGARNRFGNVHLTRYLGLGSNLLHNIDQIYIKQDKGN